MKVKKGFTLIEILAALAIMSIIFTSIYAVFNYGIRENGRITKNNDIDQIQRDFVSHLTYDATKSYMVVVSNPADGCNKVEFYYNDTIIKYEYIPSDKKIYRSEKLVTDSSYPAPSLTFSNITKCDFSGLPATPSPVPPVPAVDTFKGGVQATFEIYGKKLISKYFSMRKE